MQFNDVPVVFRQMTNDGFEYTNKVPSSVANIDYYDQIKDSSDDNLVPTDWLVGNSIIKGYNNDGYLVMISDQFGNYYFIKYDNGYIKQIIDNKGNICNFIYDDRNFLESISNSKGQTEKFSYGIYDQISKVSFFNAGVQDPYKEIEFGVTVKSQNSSTTEITFAVDDVVEDEKRCKLEYDYRIRKIKNSTLVNKIPDGEAMETEYATKEFTYEPDNSRTTITDERGDKKIYRYNQDGKITEHYNIVNNLVVDAIRYTYAEGETSMFDTIEKCDKEVLNKSELSSFVFKCGEKKKIDYNYLKQIMQESVSEVKVSEDTTYSSSVNYYRSTTNNNILSTETSENYSTEGVTTYIYRIQEQYFYGENNNLIKKVKHFSSRNDSNPVLGFEPDYCEVEEYTYNDKGLITATQKYCMNWDGHDDGQCDCSSEADTDIFRKEKSYLENGLVHKEKDETCLHETEYEYVGNTKLVSKITKANGGNYFYTYDHEDRVKALSSTVNGLENSNHTQYQAGEVVHLYADATDKIPSIGYEYDGKLRISKIIYNNNTYATFSYEEGVSYKQSTVDTVEMVNAQNETFKTISDRSGRFVEKYYNSILWASEDYNADGTPSEYYDHFNNYVISFDYDSVGNVTRCSVSYGYEGENSGVLSYEQNYEYGARGDVSKIIESGVVNRTKMFIYENTSARRLKSMACGSYNVFYDFDLNNRYIGKKVGYNIPTVYTQSIVYRKEGNVATNMPAEVQFKNSDGAIDTRLTYTYDENNNISTIKNNTVLQAKYEYDALDRLVREDNLAFGKSYFFVYDDNGNILSKETADYQSGEYVQGTSDDIAQYLYNGDKLVSYNGQAISYDAMGNPTTYRGKTLVWSQSKNLISYNGLTCVYNYKKLRIRKGNKYYIYDGQDRLIYIRDTISNEDMSFVYDEVGLLGFTYCNEDYVYKTDAHGNIIAILDKNGNTVVEYYYDAWGNYAINDTSNIGLGEINPFRYRGYFYDTDMGLYYLKTRYYDPEVGRFINMDGISYADPETINGLNLYAYCGNNPVMNVDLLGESWDSFKKNIGNWFKKAGNAVKDFFVDDVYGGAIKPAYDWVRGVAVPAVSNFFTDTIPDFFVNKVWNDGVIPAWDATTNFFTNTVPNFFKNTVWNDWIVDKTWNQFVVGTIWDKGLVPAWNWLNGNKWYQIIAKNFIISGISTGLGALIGSAFGPLGTAAGAITGLLCGVVVGTIWDFVNLGIIC